MNLQDLEEVIKQDNLINNCIRHYENRICTYCLKKSDGLFYIYIGHVFFRIRSLCEDCYKVDKYIFKHIKKLDEKEIFLLKIL